MDRYLLYYSSELNTFMFEQFYDFQQPSQKPNDGLCHLSRGIYTHTSYQNYPTLSQINSKVRDNLFKTVFLVPETQMYEYQRLQHDIQSSYSIQLSKDCSILLYYMEYLFKQALSTVEMRNSVSKIVNNIKYFSKCTEEDGDEIETNRCTNLKVYLNKKRKRNKFSGRYITFPTPPTPTPVPFSSLIKILHFRSCTQKYCFALILYFKYDTNSKYLSSFIFK